jgi:hypothetical protein
MFIKYINMFANVIATNVHLAEGHVLRDKPAVQ